MKLNLILNEKSPNSKLNFCFDPLPYIQVIPYINVQISKRIPELCSVYTAELIALLLAKNWIRDVKPSNSAIFTASLSSL